MLKQLFKKITTDEKQLKTEEKVDISIHLQTTVTAIERVLAESDDVIKRDLMIARKHKATLFFLGGLTDSDTVEEDVLEPLITFSEKNVEQSPSPALVKQLTEEVISLSEIDVYDRFEQAETQLMSGDAVLIIDGVQKLIVLGTRGFDNRGIEEPDSEVLIRGPRDGFNESLDTNITLLRRRIKDINLKIQLNQVGRRSHRKVAIAYIKGLANQDLIDEVLYRMGCIDMDDVPESGTIEQLIEDNVFTPFPQLLSTERPDKCLSSLLNGQIIILLDGTPFALIAPVSLQQLLKSPEDYYERWIIGSLIRILRFLSSFVALFLPALYIAMVTFHHGMIPTTLALSVAGSREGVPFPAFIEAFVRSSAFVFFVSQ